MPSRLRACINPIHQNSPKQKRKSISLSLVGSTLASSRRSLRGTSRRSSSLGVSSRSAGRGLSSRAEKLLEDGDDSDQSYRSYKSAAGNATPVRVVRVNDYHLNHHHQTNHGHHHVRNRSRTSIVSSSKTIDEEEIDVHNNDISNYPRVVYGNDPSTIISIKRSGTKNNHHPLKAFEATFPDDECPSNERQLNESSVDDDNTSAVNDAIFESPSPAESEPPEVNPNDFNDMQEGRSSDSSIVAIKEEDDDDIITNLGIEALHFIYGPNPNLHTDVFQLSPISSATALAQQLDHSYNEQMEQLELASQCSPQYQTEVAQVCGMTCAHLAFLHPKDFCDIKRDALRYAYDTLRKKYNDLERRNDDEMTKSLKEEEETLEQEEKEEQTTATTTRDGLRRALDHHLDNLGRDESTVTTMVEIDTSDASGDVGGEFWSEENCVSDEVGNRNRDFEATEGYLEAGTMPYGTDGNYSYSCEEEKVENGSNSMETVKNRSCRDREDRGHVGNGQDDEDECSNYRENHIHYENDGATASKSYYFYHSEDDEQDDVEDDDADYSSVVVPIETTLRNKEEEDSYYKQLSPTDPSEFDMLIRDSLPHDEYFDQLPPPPRDHRDSLSSTKKRSGRKEQETIFDPFNLFPEAAAATDHDNDDDAASLQSVKSLESISFVCALPPRNSHEDNEPTMGDLIDSERNTMLDMNLVNDNEGYDEQSASDVIESEQNALLEINLVRSMSAITNCTGDYANGAMDSSSSIDPPSKSWIEPRCTSSSSVVKSKKARRRKAKLPMVFHMLTSMGSVSSARSSRSGVVGSKPSVDAAAPDSSSLGKEQVESKIEVHLLDASSVVSHLTEGLANDVDDERGDQIDGLEGPTDNDNGRGDQIDGLELLDCFGSKEDLRGDNVGNDYVEDNDRLEELPVRTRGVEPDGLVMSASGDGKTSAMDDREDIEIETFLSIASMFKAMNNTPVANHYCGDDTGSVRSTPEVEDENEKDQEIDCFYAMESAGRLAQLNEDEISTASSVGDNNCCAIPCFDECVEDVGESIDISFHVVEKFYRRAVCCEGPEKS